jgi:hypothetical protein
MEKHPMGQGKLKNVSLRIFPDSFFFPSLPRDLRPSPSPSPDRHVFEYLVDNRGSRCHFFECFEMYSVIG